MVSFFNIANFKVTGFKEEIDSLILFIKGVEQFHDELIDGTGHNHYTHVPFTSGIETYIEVLLKYAQTLPELYIKDPLEFKLLLQLRRLAESIEIQGDLDEKLVLKFGEVQVYMKEKREIVIHTSAREALLTEQDLSKSPRAIYKAIKEMLLIGGSHE